MANINTVMLGAHISDFASATNCNTENVGVTAQLLPEKHDLLQQERLYNPL